MFRSVVEYEVIVRPNLSSFGQQQRLGVNLALGPPFECHGHGRRGNWSVSATYELHVVHTVPTGPAVTRCSGVSALLKEPRVSSPLPGACGQSAAHTSAT